MSRPAVTTSLAPRNPVVRLTLTGFFCISVTWIDHNDQILLIRPAIMYSFRILID